VSAVLNGKIETTTDATRGQPLLARVLARTDELEDALADCGESPGLRRTALQAALATAHALMAGQAASTAPALSAWLERNKHLG
jgi:hypothetical protein